MKKIKIINFSIAYTKYLSKLSEKISTDEIDLEYVWCKNMSYWEPTMKSSDNFNEIKMSSISIPIKNDFHGKHEETFSFEFFQYMIKKKPDLLVIDSNLAFSFFYLLLAKLLKTKIISLTTNFPDTKTFWGKISNKILKINDIFIDHYVVPSSRKKDDMIELGINFKKITSIGHGVDIELFKIQHKKEINNIPTNKKIILSIGRFSKKKGRKYLIDSFHLVNKKLKDTFLVIICNGSEKQNIINLIKEKNLEHDVLLIDEIKNSKTPEYYSTADVVAVSTIEPEPFGPIYLESMASGKPMVAFDVDGGEKDLIVNGENGFLVKNRNVNEMSDAIIELLTNTELQKSMGDYSRKIIEENYSYRILAEKWISVILKILS